MKIGLFTDLHANLPALEKALQFFDQQQCDQIIHMGDMVGIGPYPRECMEMIAQRKDICFVMGNHDHWYAHGLPDPIPAYMNEEEVAHHRWTHQQIGKTFQDFVKTWEFVFTMEIAGQLASFQHYALNEEKNWFGQFVKEPTPTALDQLFEDYKSDFVFYGHHHQASDIKGRCRYVNLGSAGCYNKAEVRLAILEIHKAGPKLRRYSLSYEDEAFLKAYEERKVPARDFIKKAFLGRS